MRSNNPSYYLDLVLDYFSDDKSRLRTESVTRADISAIAGKSFNSTHRFEVDIANPLYVLFENPSVSGVDVELLERTFQTSESGADLIVLWDYDVSNATQTEIESFNNNNNYRDTEAALSISVLNAVTQDADTGIYTVTGSYTPTDSGIIREVSTIVSSGVGSNQSGDITSSTGVRVYAPSTGYLVKITSAGNDNIVTLGYTWDEQE